MNKELLLDMFYAAPEVWYLLLAAVFFLAFLAISAGIKVADLKQQNYILDRDNKRYSETLFASKDGYFAFVYTDLSQQNESFQKCSRRLAIILNLPNGRETSFEDILKIFYKEDVDKINKYLGILKDDGVSFEDAFCLKNGKTMILNGVRISASDGSVFGDIIWFKDISRNTDYINKLTEEKKNGEEKIRNLENLIDNLPYPVWLRDFDLKLKLVNKKYIELLNKPNIDIAETLDDSDAAMLAKNTQESNREQKIPVSINKNGERLCFEMIESPFYEGNMLNKIATAGSLIDISQLDNLKRNLKQHQNTHLEILGILGTAFAVFNSNLKLSFYNKAFSNLWGLEEEFLDKDPSYSLFLDALRDKRLLPEVPNYPYYRTEEQKAFNTLIETKEDMLHLPDSRSLRRIRAPHISGGLIFAFEDISEGLTARREYNSIVSVQQEILDNLEEAVLIFASNGRLKFYNQAFVQLWDADEILLRKEPSLGEILESQKKFFNKVSDWESLKQDIANHVLSNDTQAFSLNRSDKATIECLSTLLSNESIMLIQHKCKS